MNHGELIKPEYLESEDEDEDEEEPVPLRVGDQVVIKGAGPLGPKETALAEVTGLENPGQVKNSKPRVRIIEGRHKGMVIKGPLFDQEWSRSSEDYF